MRPLSSPEEAAKRRKRNQTILVVILGFIMIASTLGFAIQSNLGNSPSSQKNQTKYNSYTFTNQNGLWILGNYVFRNLPQQVPDIGSGINTATSYQGKPAYIYSEDNDAEIEIQANLGQIAQRIQEACPSGMNCVGNLPVKTCTDNFIIIKENNTSLIRQDNNCVYIQGQKEQLTALADQFLFKVLGIK